MREGLGFANGASGAGGYKWFVRGVKRFVPQRGAYNSNCGYEERN